jgi:outer membrane immunogenic protein
MNLVCGVLRKSVAMAMGFGLTLSAEASLADSDEMTRLLRNQAGNGFQIIDGSGLGEPEIVDVPTSRRKRREVRDEVSGLTAAGSRKLPSHAHYAPPAPLLPLWTGFYAGVNWGGVFGGSSLNTAGSDVFDTGRSLFGAASAVSATSRGSLNKRGYIGGGQIGFNYQIFERFVVGVEADIQGLRLGGGGALWNVTQEEISDIPLVTITDASKSLSYLGTVRGRLGYLVSPTLLAYATSGLAYGGTSAHVSFLQMGVDPSLQVGPASSSNSFSGTRFGWTLGAGGEWFFDPRWSVKLEYLYYDLGGITISNVLRGSNLLLKLPLYDSILHSSTRFNGHSVRVGLNFKFSALFSSIPIFTYQ